MNTRTVRRKGAVIDVTPMEYRVLEYLMARSEAVVSKTELLEHLYDYNWEKFSNVLEVFISGLRRKIDRDGWPKLIHTVRGHGYVVRGHKR
jgi:two-component system response regulator PhoP